MRGETQWRHNYRDSLSQKDALKWGYVVDGPSVK
jgi:hypothetical protein